MHPSSPSPPPTTTTTLIEDDPIDKEEQFVSEISQLIRDLTLLLFVELDDEATSCINRIVA
jgi:hypothetical protein